jgi:phage head maturation protease
VVQAPMNPAHITLRGYAAPYGQPACIGRGELEQFAPGAFSQMLERPRKIELRWDTHDDSAPKLASTGAGSLSFFEDEYGLGFAAKLNTKDPRNWSRLRTMVQKTKPFCLVSVGGLAIKHSRRELLQLGTTEVITAATIDHITICDDAAYRGTAVWPTHLPLDDAPLKIQQLDARWAAGHDAWDRRMSARRKVEASLRPIGRTVGGHIVMVAADGRLFQKTSSGRVIW